MLATAKIKVPEGVLSQSLENETILLNMDSGLFFGLTPVASRIWALLAAGHTPLEVHRMLLEEYRVDPAVLEQDLEDLLHRLAEKGLIQYVDAA
ncbi:PqqD family protein [Pseudacidobacterium ailaaui]|jgi:hypothetical protein|uniref:PqqD family protein n=1 Tax=Pseudacidobacterium ailaaui TaxID=1382359 RepID=UPI00047B9844|nr:PqqD family protein [Pseudacidobacterium ailaaui]MDI3255792.1 PqqD family protein [Bacillota bacterium]